MRNNNIDRLLANKGLLTPAEAATYINFDAETIRRWVRTGKLKAFKFGSARNAPVRIDPSDLALFINDMKRP